MRTRACLFVLGIAAPPRNTTDAKTNTFRLHVPCLPRLAPPERVDAADAAASRVTSRVSTLESGAEDAVIGRAVEAVVEGICASVLERAEGERGEQQAAELSSEASALKAELESERKLRKALESRIVSLESSVSVLRDDDAEWRQTLAAAAAMDSGGGLGDLKPPPQAPALPEGGGSAVADTDAGTGASAEGGGVAASVGARKEGPSSAQAADLAVFPTRPQQGQGGLG